VISSSSIAIHIKIHHHFSTFLRLLTSTPPMVCSGPLSAKSLPGSNL